MFYSIKNKLCQLFCFIIIEQNMFSDFSYESLFSLRIKCLSRGFFLLISYITSIFAT